MAVRPMLRTVAVVLAFVYLAGFGCSKKTPPVSRPVPPSVSGAGTGSERPAAPPQPLTEVPVVPSEALREDTMASRSVDDLNRDSPLKPAFFEYDSSEISVDAQAVLTANASLLKKYSSWVVTIEGHCDERGTAEYNLALGERRAVAAKSYLLSLGIPADRLRTVSYGKEFPFDPAHNDEAWAKNRRDHFVVTQK